MMEEYIQSEERFGLDACFKVISRLEGIPYHCHLVTNSGLCDLLP